MKFRTEIMLPASGLNIDHGTSIFMVGSCFSEHIASRLSETGFNVLSNPTGILFNPLSIYVAFKNLAVGKRYTEIDLHYDAVSKKWFSYDFHGSFSRTDPDAVLSGVNRAISEGSAALAGSDVVFVTFGTAWIYELCSSGAVVANCHKQPSGEFVRRKLDVQQIYDNFSELLLTTLKDKQVVFTISPVRHLSDGFQQNFLSKTTLRMAIERLENYFDNVRYFPAYEIVNDDLRDYRFYADDLIHPSSMAVSYIWSKFAAWAMTKEMQSMLPKLERSALASKHRPLLKT